MLNWRYVEFKNVRLITGFDRASTSRAHEHVTKLDRSHLHVIWYKFSLNCHSIYWPEQWTPTTVDCGQLCLPRPVCLHSRIDDSFPRQATFPSHMSSAPNWNSDEGNGTPCCPKLSCLHITVASSMVNDGSQIEPHRYAWYISTRPSNKVFPPIMRTPEN